MGLPIAESRFDCDRCVKCCTNSLREGAFGLSMFDFEAEELLKKAKVLNLSLNLVPSSFAQDSDGNAVVVQWKMENHQCPFLKDNTCLAYEMRPLVCRSFPVASTGLHGKMPMMRSLLCPEEKGLPSLGVREPAEIAIPKLMFRYHKNFLACYLLEELVIQQEKDVSELVGNSIETDWEEGSLPIGILSYLRRQGYDFDSGLAALKKEIAELEQTRLKLKTLLKSTAAPAQD